MLHSVVIKITQKNWTLLFEIGVCLFKELLLFPTLFLLHVITPKVSHFAVGL